MDEPSAAAVDWHILHSLLQRSAIHRAIFAPSALVGCVFTGITAGLIYAGNARGTISAFHLSYPSAARQFMTIWSVVLLATVLAAAFFIWRKARRENGAFLTPGLRHALYSTAPVLILVAVLTSIFWRDDETSEALPVLVALWINGYGLALLATASFAPRAVRYLGWAFLLTGAICLVFMGPLFGDDPARHSALAMALTFGFYHLVYAITNWPRNPGAPRVA